MTLHGTISITSAIAATATSPAKATGRLRKTVRGSVNVRAEGAAAEALGNADGLTVTVEVEGGPYLYTVLHVKEHAPVVRG